MNRQRILSLALILALAFFWAPAARPAQAATFTVTNTNDSGAGSLRWAITQANASVGTADIITFNIPGTGVHTIQPLTYLPYLTDNAGVVIDGYTQPGSAYATDSTAAVLVIELDGTLLPANVLNVGIGIGSSSNTVRGLVINRFPSSGIGIAGSAANWNTITGNYIGINASGTADPCNATSPGHLGNTASGVSISLGAGENTIGGDTPAERNVLSCNGWSGAEVHGTDSNLNIISGNYIGTNAAGSAALPNFQFGVRIYGGARENTVGGDTPGERNIISGNLVSNVHIAGTGTDDNGVGGNYIGTNAAGNAALGGGNGVSIVLGAQGNSIGSPTGEGWRNVISGNSNSGVSIADSNTNFNVVANNWIGLNAAGDAALPNGAHGVTIYSSSNSIGQSTALGRNVISGNTQAGVYLSGSSALSNLVIGNYIGTNPAGSAAIPNGWDGVMLAYEANNNTVGGDSAAERNVISGNTRHGVLISYTGTANNTVSGNYIGVDATGLLALGNGEYGIILDNGVLGNVVGGSLPGEGNVLSGNNHSGLMIYDSDSNIVKGNLIGTDATGMTALPNDSSGIFLQGGSQSNTIGGCGDFESNLISGNAGSGISVDSADTNLNSITCNFIGIAIDGTTPLPNQGYGISVGNGAIDTTIGPENWIAYNEWDGIFINGNVPGTIGHVITQNSIHANGDFGIALDNGVNNDVPAPVITAAVLSPATVSGTACGSCTVEVFASTANDGEGEIYLGAVTATAGGSWTLSPASIPRPYLTATATRAVDGTSEFSAVYIAPFNFIYLPMMSSN
jgi:hypothetical protein